MGRVAALVICLAIVSLMARAAAPAEKRPEPYDPRKAAREARLGEMDRLDKIMDRAYEIRPRRRDTPMRYENISDEEVREIQRVSREFVPHAIVNIGTVVKRCPCEEGAGCSEQVWIVASSAARSTGLQLSRIEKRWKVGLVQRWWFRMDELIGNRERFDSWNDYEKAQASLLDEFPVCVQTNPLVADAADLS